MNFSNIALYFILFFLTSCGGGSGDKTEIIEPITLTITGIAKFSISFNEEFNFTPNVNYTGRGTLTFSIQNQPAWSSFNSATGSLSGTPTCTWLGSYADISIAVSDGAISSKLNLFSIEVTEQTLFSIGGSPQDTVNVDEEYLFTPIIDNPERLTIGFSIENKPVWMDFDQATGKLTGPVPSNHLGLYSNINIKAHCGDIIVSLPSFDIEVVNLSNFVMTNEHIAPDYGISPPIKGETRIDPVTGAQITRLTDANEFNGSSDALIVYSRYSPENISGDYLLVFGGNSTSSWVVNRKTGNIVTALAEQTGNSIGENHEVRWHGTIEHPNRVYYISGMQFWMIDDVTQQNQTRELIKDFSQEFPQSTKIYNDVEGDSSNDSNHWAWMAVHYGENDKGAKTFLVDAFVHYKMSTNKTHSLRPPALVGSNLDSEKNRSFFSYRPNMIEMSPSGNGVLIHLGRKWDDVAYGGKGKQYINTWFDGPHLWPVDFNYAAQAPVKVSIDETHSGWSFDSKGNELFISQNNRTDKLDVVYVQGVNKGYENRIEVASHVDFGWAMGFHYGKMPESKPNWLFISTYSKDDSLWASNQLMMIEIKPELNKPRIWRVAPAYNSYQGDYRDEAPAAVNMQGNRIYFSSNWGGRLDHRESFVIELPNNWNTEALIK
jgi:hypothetical protein